MAWNTETLLMIFVALTGVAVLLQAFVLIAIYVSLRKAAKSAAEVSEDVKFTVLPLVHTTRELLERISPQVVTITNGLVDLTETLKREANGVTFSAHEVMQRVNEQTKRLDAMLTTGLDAVDRAGEVVESAVAAPIRQVNGILAAIKAIVASYRSNAPRPRTANSDGDRASGF
jgi:Mg2+/Co2+ transporter CorB